MQNNGHCTIQGHSILVPMESPVCNMQCVNNSNLSAVLHCVQDMKDYWSDFCPQQALPLFNALIGVNLKI